MGPIEIILFVFLFFLSAFFSWTELALMSLPEHKIDSLLKEKKLWSKSLKKIRENSDRLLITILIWNNLVNTFTAAFATSIAINIALSWWMWLTQSTAVWLSTWIITFLLLLFGEIIPKSIATKNSASISLIVAPIYKVLMIIIYPIISFLEILIKIFSKDSNSKKITEEEIESFMDIWKEDGALKDEEHKKIKSILEFSNTDVEEIMTPRVKIEALSRETTVKKAFEYFLNHTHSRIPVYTKTIDKISNIMTVRDLINQDEDKKLKDLNLSEVLRVPLNQDIDSLLKVFQKSRKHLAIVMDEYWGVAGLVTLEDVIEEIFWEIRDETDKETDEIREIGNDSLVVESDVLFEEVLNKLEMDYSDLWLSEKEFSGETLSYMLTEKLKRFPSSWEKILFEISNKEYVKHNNIEFRVLNVVKSKMGDVEIKKVFVEKEDI